MNKYQFVDKTGQRPVHGATNAALLGSGTFSDVYRAVATATGKHVAIKCMKNHFDSVDHVNRLREIQALRRLSPHANIVKLLEVLYDRSTGRLALVFELMEMNAYELVKGRRKYLAPDRLLHISYSLLKGLEHMHKQGIFHRDVKPENILISGDVTKIADFGSCRGIFSKQPFTEYISTRWYRAPECLLTDGYYNYKMDIFGASCVLFELAAMFPLAAGDNELDQISKLHNILGCDPVQVEKLKKRGSSMDFDFPAKAGTGIAKLIPHAGEDFIDLLNKMLIYNADDRITTKQALRHPYFKEIRELDKKLRRAQQAQAPQRNSVSGEPNLEDTKNSQPSDDDTEPTQQQQSTTTKLPSIGGKPAQPAQSDNAFVSNNSLPNLPASKTVRQQAQQQPLPAQPLLQQQNSFTSAGLSSLGGVGPSTNTAGSSGAGGAPTSSANNTAGSQLPKLMPAKK